MKALTRLVIAVIAVVVALGTACRGDSSYHGRSADDWVRLLTSASPRDRAQAVAALANIGPRELGHLRPLLMAASDPAPMIRRAATAAIGRLPETSSKALMAALDDSSTAVRRAAVLGLGHLRNNEREQIRALDRATHDADDSVRTLAVLSLGQRSSGARDALDRVRQLASQPGPQRAAALLVLPNIDTESRSVAGFYYPALTDTSSGVRAAAATMLVASGAGHEAMPLLVKALGDSAREVRIAAGRSLALEAHHDSVAYAAMALLRRSADPLLSRLADSVLRTINRPR